MTVTTIYAKVFTLLNLHKNQLTFALLIPFCLFMVLDYISATQPLSYLQQLSIEIFDIFIYVFFAINIHKILLLGADSTPRFGYLSWSKRETKFLGYLILLGVILATPFILVTVPLLSLIALIVLAWLSARYSLVFPATALGHSTSLSRSWSLTQKYSSTIFFAMYTLPMSFAIILHFLNLNGAHYLSISLLSNIIAIFTVGILSVIYKVIIDEEIAESSNKDTVNSEA